MYMLLINAHKKSVDIFTSLYNYYVHGLNTEHLFLPHYGFL